jgi:hypothetical protein
MPKLIREVSESQAIQYAKNYRGAKRAFQGSLAYIVAQAFAGNADACHRVFTAAGMLTNIKGELFASKDASAAWQYLTDSVEKGGCGLSGILRFDREANKFTMAKEWAKKFANVDVAAVWVNIATLPWDQHMPKPAASAFDLDKAILRLIKRASDNGVKASDVAAHMLKLAAA